MASLKDYYDILGIRRGATEEEVEKAYRKLARAYQVDSYSGNRAAEIRFGEIAEAYAVLSNKNKRAKYDQAGLNSSASEADREFEWEEEEICNFEGFEEFFEESFGKESVSKSLPQKGKEIHHLLRIGFEEAVRGTAARIQVEEEVSCPECLGQGYDPQGPLEPCRECGGAGHLQVGLYPEAFTQRCRRCQGWGRLRRKPCSSCEGTKRGFREKTLSLSVPPGVSDGCRIYVKGAGGRGLNGGANGDLVVTLEIQKHPFFQKRGEDLYVEVPLTVWEAALGTRMKVPTLKGSAWITVPPGVQNGQKMRLEGKGGPSLHGKTKGSQVLTFKIVVPRDLDPRSLDLLRELNNRAAYNPREECGWPGGRKNRETESARGKSGEKRDRSGLGLPEN
jgi:molecular chaperone DnaJ